MAVKIVRRVEPKAANEAKDGSAPSPLPHVIKKAPGAATQATGAPVEGRPTLTKAIKLGKETILPDLDAHDVLGNDKFLVHLKKKGVWYKVLGFDEAEGTIKLQSQVNNKFDSKITRTAGKFYMVVVAPKGTVKPSDTVIEAVFKLGGSVSTALPWAGENEMHLSSDKVPDLQEEQESEPEPARKSKGKITIVKRGAK